MTQFRYDLIGDRHEVDDTTEGAGPSRKQLARKGRPIGGLARALADLGGKCDTCQRFICACEEAARGRHKAPLSWR